MNTENKNNDIIETQPKKVGFKEIYKSIVVCESCNKTLSLKCLKYVHKCTHPNAPPQQYNK